MNLNAAALGFGTAALQADTSKASKSETGGDFLSLVLGVSSSVKGKNSAAKGITAVNSAGAVLSGAEAKRVLTAASQIAGEILSGGVADVSEALDGLSDDGKQAVLMLLEGLLSQIVSGEEIGEAQILPQTEGGIFNSVFGELLSGAENFGTQKAENVLSGDVSAKDDSENSKDVLTMLVSMIGQIFAQENEISAGDSLQSGHENAVLKIGEVEIPLAVSHSDCKKLLEEAIGEIKAEIYPQQMSNAQNSAAESLKDTAVEGGSEVSSNEQAAFSTGAQGKVFKSDSKIAFYVQEVASEMASAERNAEQTAKNDGASSSLKLISEGNTAKTVAAQKISDKKDELEEIGIKSEAANIVQPLDNSEIKTEEPAKLENADSFDANQIAEKAKAQITTLKTGEKAEMTMTLHPESLGEITVKLQNDGGKVSVLIAAHSEATQKLLQERLPELVSSLRQVNSGDVDVKVANAQESQYAGFGFGNSGFGSSSDGSRSQRNEQFYYSSVNVSDSAAEEAGETEFRGGNRLWQTA